MNVVSLRNEPIGEVERFEIDRNGVLTALIVRLSSSLDSTRRIAADRIREFERGRIRVAVSRAELRAADDVARAQPRVSRLPRSSAW